MFTVTNVIEKSYPEVAFPIAQIEGTNNLVSNFPVYTVNTIVQTPNTESKTLDIPLQINSNGNEIITVPIDKNINSVTSINIYGKEYAVVKKETELGIGKYYYDDYKNEIKIYLEENSYVSNTVIKLNTNIEKLNSNRIKGNPYLTPNNYYPEFIKQYNCKGTISINRSYNDHPSCTFTLFSNKSNLINIENEFNAYKNKELFNKKFIFYSIPFRIRSYAIKLSSLETRPLGEYEVTINFEGWYINLLNKNIPLKNNNTTNTNTGIECNINTNNQPGITTNSSPLDSNKLRISFNELVAKIGLDYKGTNYNYDYDKSVSNDATVQFNSILEPKVIGNSEYVLYSLNTGIETPKWNGVNINVITQSEVLQEISINYNCNPIVIAPSILNWNNSNENKNNTNEDTYQNKTPEYEFKIPKKSTVISGDKNPESPPSNYKFIQTLDLNADKSGETKTKITRNYEGTTLISETTDIYGLAYIGSEVASNGKIFSAIGGTWKKISSETVTHIYDYQTGYYLGNDIVGFKLCRFQQETDALETITLEPNDPMITTYNFFSVPIKGSTRYVLRQHRDYYKDLASNSNGFIIYDWCTSDGKLVRKSMKDPTYVQDMFIGVEETYKQCFASRPHPESNTTNPLPDLTTGEIYQSGSEIKIYNSKNIVQNLSSFSSSGDVLRDNVVGTDYQNTEDKYFRYIKNYAASDSNFANCIQDIKMEECSGRPGTANRRPSYYILVNDKQQLAEQKKEETNNQTKTEYIIYSLPYTVTDSVTGNMSYDCDSLEKALEAANTDFSKQKTTSEGSLSITTFFNPNYIEGQKLQFNYGFDDFNCRILSINHSIEIQGIDESGELILTGITNLGLGLDSSDKIQYYTRPVKDNNAPSNDDNDVVNLLDLYKKGYELGQLIDYSGMGKSRGNF